jgi:predicted ATPase/DNA-binding winged helix-turn-helix (wHTH) protein
MAALNFGSYKLNRRERELLGPDGPVELNARSFDILTACLERPGELISKAELLEAAWPGIAVEENTLQVHMSALRKILGSGYIATVHGRGYRYVGPLPREEDTPALPPGPGGNLGRYQVECVAREAEKEAVANLLEHHRLVSVLGAGGVGKTTLALAAATGIAQRFQDGAWVIDLAAIADGALVESAVIQTMGIPFRANSRPLASILDRMRSQKSLLVLDNCEHVAAPVGRLARELLADTQHLRILTTSQVPLGIPAEHVFRLTPFALTGTDAMEGETPATRFLAYCLESLGETVDPEEIPVVARLCRRLDGVALALKMAAARAATLGIEAVDRQIEEQLAGVLVAGWDTSLPRHRSLSASLSWSHDLLSETDRRALRSLGVFQGSFTLEGFRAVPGGASDDSLAELVRRSLIVRNVGDRYRYRLLETTRHFALGQLKASEDERLARTRHARFMDGLVAESISSWETMRDDAWLALYQPDLDNLRAALDWTRQQGDWPLHLSIAGHSYRLFIHTQLPTEGMGVCEEAMAHEQGLEPGIGARLRLALAELARIHRADVRVREVLEPALATFAALGDRTRLAQALALKGITQLFGSDQVGARETVAELDRLTTDMPANKLKARALVVIGMSNWFTGDRALARARFDAGLAMQSGLGNERGHFKSVMMIAEVLHQTGDNDGAIALVERTMPELRRRGTPQEIGYQASNLATYWLSVGNAVAARPLLEEAAAALTHDDERNGYWCVILSAGELAVMNGNLETGAMLLGFVDACFATVDDGYQMTEQMQRRRMLARLEQGLSLSDLDRLCRQGAALSLFEAGVLGGVAKDLGRSMVQASSA